MASKKIAQNIDLGMWARNRHGIIGSAFEDLEPEHLYRLNFHPEEMPAHRSQTFSTLEELETAMRQFEPDLRKWHTAF